MQIDVLWESEDLIAVNKPSGLLVHKTKMDAGETQFLLQFLRDQVGYHVFPLHRLDKATSGVCLFAKKAEAVKPMQDIWNTDSVKKEYRCLVRGWFPEKHIEDSPLEEIKKEKERTKESQGEKKKAISIFKPKVSWEVPVAIGKFPKTRYQLVDVEILTGRRHQIRRHACRQHHPIIGDSTYGDGKHNLYFREELGFQGLMLSSNKIQFREPSSNKWVEISAYEDSRFVALAEKFRDSVCT